LVLVNRLDWLSYSSNQTSTMSTVSIPHLRSFIANAIAVLCILSSATAIAGGSRLEILFLGDNGHHKPQARFKQLAAAMGIKGINVTYTADISDLNPETLGLYDGLIVYANTTEISPDQEKALLTYVYEGGGFIPLHCASYCFLNSMRYTQLVGARFKSHGTGIFDTDIVNPDHPIMQGFKGFETWDETYVHEMHASDRTILQQRSGEPWTWVRTPGKGRVFYTAYGHDERTWGNAGFVDLIERGILWAVGDQAKEDLEKLELAPFNYEDAVLPNYERRDPPPKMQEPLSPARSMKYAQVPADMDLELFASEPDIVNPIAMAWDQRGRLWILETIDYPNNLQKGNIGNDRLRILEDTDNDGEADKFTTFADKLSIPTTICFANDGVIITNGSQILFLQDTDGDDISDERTVLIDGWNMGDTHAGPSNFQWGYDNWIWGTVGYSGFKGIVGGKQHEFRMGVFRFKPDGSEIEFLQNTTNNTWGLGLTEDGDVIGSTANNNPSWYLTFPKRYYDTAPSLKQPSTPRADVTRDFYPITPNVRQVDVFGGFTAAAGHKFYTARNFPSQYWNKLALICGPTGHLLYSGMINEVGTSIQTVNGGNLYASADAWSAPVAADVGPDGAVWMADWYNVIIQHNPTPTKQRGGYDAKTGRGNAYMTPLRDKKHGRIYRIAWNKARDVAFPELSKEKPEQLVNALRNDNQLWRMHAQRLLVERQNKDVVGRLLELVRDTTVDSTGINPGAHHALWTLHGLGVFSEGDSMAVQAASAALNHPARAVRRTALSVLPKSEALVKAVLESGLLEDPDARTLRDALLALSECPASADTGQAIFAASHRNRQIENDAVLRDAAIVAAAQHSAGFVLAALDASDEATLTSEQESSSNQSNPDLFTNGDFAELDGTLPKHWKARTYSGTAAHQSISPGRGGSGYCLQINSEEGSDSSMFQEVKVSPISNYRLTAWIKTEGIRTRGNNAQGALLNVHALPGQPRTPAVKGTSDWKQVSMDFKTDERETIQINCLFGGWGHATGTAFWDDIELRQIGKSGAVKPLAITVAENYRQQATADDITNLATKIEKAKRQLTQPLMIALGVVNEKEKAVTDELGRVIVIKTIPQKLLYDVKSLTAKAGEKVTLRFVNDCDLPHNLILCAPGSMEKVGMASIDMVINDTQALEKQYVPDLPEILHATRLLNSGEQQDLTFTVPATPGAYPYVCTFPGHFQLMNGILTVE
jgi:putative membrane-bound dehydrogenase-like protein